MEAVETRLLAAEREILELRQAIYKSGLGSAGHNRTHGTDDHVPRNNWSAAAAPGVGDDTGDGYGVGSTWIDTTNDKAYVCLDATSGAAVWTETTVGATMKAPQVMTPASLYSVGADIAAFALAAPTSQTWAVANRAIYIPFWLPEAVTLTQIFWYNGATAASNTDAAIYNEAWARQITTGSTAMSGTNAIQAVNVADTALAVGRYYLALNNDSATDTFFCWTITADQGKAMGLAQEAAAFALPATATPATMATTRLPIVGFTIRTIV